MSLLDEPDYVTAERDEAARALLVDVPRLPDDYRAVVNGHRADSDGAPPDDPFRLHPLTIAELRNLRPPSPLVYGLLDLDSLTVGYGPPGAGKSFVALDLACRVSTGTRWHHERVVTAGPVIYVAAEGAHGMPARIDAWKEANSTIADPDRMLIVPAAVNLLSGVETDALVDLVAREGPHLVVIDTLARCLIGGDENSARDMGLAVAALDRVRRAAGSCVFVVHHAGKNREAGARGSSALLGAADTMISIAGDEAVVTVTPEKQKHHPTGRAVTLRMEPCAGSVALVPYDGVLGDEMSSRERDALVVLAEIVVAEGVSFTGWRDAALEAGISKATVSRARKKALETGLIEAETNSSPRSPRYVLTDAGRSQLAGTTDVGGEQA